MQTTRPENGRGCGDRKEGAGYVCCGVGAEGMPIEYFVVDPAIPWPGEFQRGVKILPRSPKEPDGLQDLAIFVGKKDYPSAWDFVEEARRFGASRKISENLPLEKLTPGLDGSRMVFIHSRAIPGFDYVLDRKKTPLRGCVEFQFYVDHKDLWVDTGKSGIHVDEQKCTFALRDLAFLLSAIETYRTEDFFTPDFYRVVMPSFSYQAKYPTEPETYLPKNWKIGIFLALPLTHIEFCRKPNPKVVEKAAKAGFETVTLEW